MVPSGKGVLIPDAPLLALLAEACLTATWGAGDDAAAGAAIEEEDGLGDGDGVGTCFCDLENEDGIAALIIDDNVVGLGSGTVIY